MAVQMISLVELCYPDESLAEYTLAAMLAGCANIDGTSIYPSLETMAEFARQTVRTAQRNLRKMVADDWLQVVRPATNRKPTEYRINPLWIRDCDKAIAAHGRRRRQRIAPARPADDAGGRGDIATPQEKAMARGDIVTPQDAAAGMTPATARGDIDAGAYIGEPSETHTPQPPKGGEGFARLLAAYPVHRRNTAAALKQWRKLQPDPALQETIVAAARQQSAQPRWQHAQGQHVPNLSKWLRNEGWIATHPPAAPAAPTAVTKDQGPPAPELTPEQREDQRRRAAEARDRARRVIEETRRKVAHA